MDDSPFAKLSLELREDILEQIYNNAAIDDTNSISGVHSITYHNFNLGISRACRQLHLESKNVFYRVATYNVQGSMRAQFKDGPADIPRDPAAPPKHLFRRIQIMNVQHGLWANCRLNRPFLSGFESLRVVNLRMYFYTAIIEAHKQVNKLSMSEPVNVLQMTMNSGVACMEEIRLWEQETRNSLGKSIKVMCVSRYEEKQGEVREAMVDMRHGTLIHDRACDGEDLYGGQKRERMTLFGV